jgi:secreted trypsin-like serine protease
MGVAWQGNYTDTLPPRYDVGYLVLSAAAGVGQIKIAGADEGALWDPGSYLEVTGWGSTSACSSSCSNPTSDTLKKAGVNVVADSTCSGYHPEFDANTMLCAGDPSGGTDSCTGDSGGPLQAPLAGGGYRLVGAVSWGRGCAQPGTTGVYARVAGATLRSLIESDVASLQATYGLPAEGIIGRGGQPLGAAPPSSPATTRSNPYAKCKRIRDKRKRKRCIKRVRKKLRSQR